MMDACSDELSFWPMRYNKYMDVIIIDVYHIFIIYCNPFSFAWLLVYIVRTYHISYLLVSTICMYIAIHVSL